MRNSPRRWRETLEWDVLVPDDRITTTVSHGNVTLQGSVDTFSRRYDAEKAIHRLTGVRNVINRITVTGKPVDAAQLEHDIESALERQAEREAKRIGIAVRDAVVSITGVGAHWAEKNAIEKTVKFSPGVRRVENHVKIEPYL